jgi:hypothetical protein
VRAFRCLAVAPSLPIFLLHIAQARAQTPLRVSPAAQAEIRTVEKSVQRLGSQDTARASGFEPRLGWFPTMGVHWVNDSRMQAGRTFTLSEPAHLMFSPIAGKDSLVGAAYAYFAPLSDTTRPATFQGNPPWHEHPNLAPEGQTLTMLHVWFVPSPDGPFAGHNPNLAFWALGLTPPDPARMRDPAEDTRIRKTALALGTLADTTGIFPNVARREPMHSLLAAMARRPDTEMRARVPLFEGRHGRKTRTCSIRVRPRPGRGQQPLGWRAVANEGLPTCRPGMTAIR